jgi:hypothetical protein
MGKLEAPDEPWPLWVKTVIGVVAVGSLILWGDQIFETTPSQGSTPLSRYEE